MAMPRQLLILRHAKSDGAKGYDLDFARNLNQQGRRTIKNMALWMRREQLIPDQIVSSDAERARQTTLHLCQFAEIPNAVITWRRSIYEASVETLLNIIAQTGEAIQTLLLVGHNPGIEQLVCYLADETLRPWAQPHMIPTATLSELTFRGNWTDLECSSATVKRIARPQQLFDD